MKKTLYSLMLNEEVVREIDAMAHQMGTNRSALINQILADYVSVLTPERRIENIFHAIEEMVAPARELVPFFVPNAMTMTLKPDRRRINWDRRETVGYSSMGKVAPDSKVCTDFFGNVLEGDRMPGPFNITEDEITFSIDPRKL